jgi:molybdopterin/thiamine biosynthesis adenylyltransferase
MNDEQLLRYSRHILLDEIGIEGQDKLLKAHVLIVGAGGMGSPVALYLGSAGVGHLTIADHDRVDATNLQRQIAHNLSASASSRPSPRGRPSRQSTLTSRSRPSPSAQRARCSTAWSGEADLVLDCTDNFATRHAINRACVKHRKPLVSGAAIRFDGQVAVFDARDAKIRPAMPAYSLNRSCWKKPCAPPWACSRRWSASSEARRPPKP